MLRAVCHETPISLERRKAQILPLSDIPPLVKIGGKLSLEKKPIPVLVSIQIKGNRSRGYEVCPAALAFNKLLF